MFTLYLHIPYCIVKCGYCDFHSLATKRDEIPHQAYAQAILAQLKMQVELHQLSGQKIGAIFFGGGTPSLMEPTFFEQVLVEIQKTFSFANDLEVTSEMNPATAKLDWLKAVRAIGINRLSIGIQSFNPKYLKFLDRDHTASDVHSVMNDARTAGFENMSCDLIYSIPGQTTEEVASDVNTALSFAPQHVSAYQLTFEPGTPLTKRYQHASPLGLPPKISDDASLEQFQCVTAMFEAAGLHRYEISNYARPDFESRHNLNYWQYGEYLGLGSGAVSFVDRKRWTTTRNVGRYLQGDFEPKDLDAIDQKTAMGEFCFMGLRTRDGISTEEFAQRFKIPLKSVFPGIFEELARHELVVQQGSRVELTDRGIELSNEVFRRLVG